MVGHVDRGGLWQEGWAMAGDLGKHGQRGSIRVNILEAQELQAWCAEFGCTGEQMKTGLSRAGLMATDVRAFPQEQDWIPTPRRPRGFGRLVARLQPYR